MIYVYSSFPTYDATPDSTSPNLKFGVEGLGLRVYGLLVKVLGVWGLGVEGFRVRCLGISHARHLKRYPEIQPSITDVTFDPNPETQLRAIPRIKSDLRVRSKPSTVHRDPSAAALNPEPQCPNPY